MLQYLRCDVTQLAFEFSSHLHLRVKLQCTAEIYICGTVSHSPTVLTYSRAHSNIEIPVDMEVMEDIEEDRLEHLSSPERPFNEVIIIMCGPLKSGKSSTLETVFERIPITSATQKHRYPVEYTKMVPLLQHEAEVKLRIVDFPGLPMPTKEANNTSSNTQSSTEDPTQSAILRTQCQSLKGRWPNLVLFCIPALVVLGKDSATELKKYLNVLLEYRIVDTVKPNLIVIVTHTLKIPKVTFFDDEEEAEATIRNVVKEVAGLKHVVIHFIENDFKVYQKQRLFLNELQELQGKMKSLMHGGGDELGAEAVDPLFSMLISYDTVFWEYPREVSPDFIPERRRRSYKFNWLGHGCWQKNANFNAEKLAEKSDKTKS